MRLFGLVCAIAENDEVYPLQRHDLTVDGVEILDSILVDPPQHGFSVALLEIPIVVLAHLEQRGYRDAVVHDVFDLVLLESLLKHRFVVVSATVAAK